jgi:hypothetical protein
MNRANRPRMSRISGSSRASKLMTRAGDGSTLSIDFTTGVLDSRITFSRADATARATFINSLGYVATVASAQDPRFDFDPITLAAKGLLIETAATNLALRSTTMGSATYTAQDVTQGTGSSTDPSNTASAPTITAIPAFSYSSHLVYSTVTVSNATAYTLSVYAKANGYNRVGVCIASGARYTAVFNLTGDGSFETSASTTSPAPTGTGYAISALGNGWYRCSVTMTSANTTLYPHIMLVNDGAITFNSFAQATFVGDATKGIYLWGAQLETGTTASSFIPTTTIAVTRAVDTAIIAAGSNFSSWYTGGTTGTFVANWYGNAASSTARTVIATNDETNKHLHLYQTPSALTLRLADRNAVATVTTANSMTAGALTKGAFSYASTATNLCLNGGTVASGTLAFSSDPTWLSIGAPSTNGTSITGTTVVLNNSIRSIKYWPTVLPNATLQSLTT